MRVRKPRWRKWVSAFMAECPAERMRLLRRCLWGDLHLIRMSTVIIMITMRESIIAVTVTAERSGTVVQEKNYKLIIKS